MQAIIRGYKVSYEEYGCGPAIVLISGDSSVRPNFDDLALRLSSGGYRVIIPDLSGEAGRQSSVVVKLMDYLGIGKAVMISFQNGDGVVDELTRNHSRRVAGVWDSSSCMDHGLSHAADDSVMKREEVSAKVHAFLKRFAAGRGVQTAFGNVA